MTIVVICGAGPGNEGNITKPKVEEKLELLMFARMAMIREVIITARLFLLRVNTYSGVPSPNHPSAVLL